MSTGPDVYAEIPFISYTFQNYLDWNELPAVTIKVDNHRGTNANLLPIGSVIKITRNGVDIFKGIIQKPTRSIDNSAHALEFDAVDYYRQTLTDRLTSDSKYWNFTLIDQRDLLQACIGTEFIVQERFQDTSATSKLYNFASTSSNIMVQPDQVNSSSGRMVVQIAPNTGGVYQASGYVYGMDARGYLNPCLWDAQITSINTVNATIYGTPAVAITNIITSNSDFETGNLTGWTATQGGGSVAVSTEQAHTGTHSLKATCSSYTTWYGAESSKYAAGAGQTVALTAWTKGTASGAAHIYLNAYTAGDAPNGSVSIDLTGVNDVAWKSRNVQYVLPANTAKVTAYVKMESNGTIYVDDVFMSLVTTDVKLEVARDATNYSTVPVYWNGSSWTGSYTFVDAPATKNHLKYKLTLTAQSSNTKTPTVNEIDLICGITSDIGMSVSNIDTFTNPLGGANTNLLTVDLSNMNRQAAITKIIKLTGFETWNDTLGNFYSEDPTATGYGRGQLRSTTLTVGQNFVQLSNQTDRNTLINALSYVSNGQITNGVSWQGTWNGYDAASIATYGRKEGIIRENGLTDQGMINLRGYILLQKYKAPVQQITGSLFWSRNAIFDVGDGMTVTDPTGVTAINSQLRIMKYTITHDAKGEKMDFTLGNRIYETGQAVQSMVTSMNEAAQQASPTISPVGSWRSADVTHPVQLFFWIDTTRQVKDIRLIAASAPFRATSTGASSGGSSTSGGGGGQTSSFASQAHVHNITAPNHWHGYTSRTVDSYKVVVGGTNYYLVRVDGTYPAYLMESISNNVSSSDSVSSDAQGSVHTHSVSDHTHSVSAHTHPITYGIYEFSNYAEVQLYINPAGAPPTFVTANPAFGTQGNDGTTGWFNTLGMSLMPYYSASGSGVGLFGAGFNAVYMKPNSTANNTSGLIDIFVTIFVEYL